MKGDQGKVIQRSPRSAQRRFQNLGCALDDLDQVVVHGAGHVKDERQGGCALRNVLLCGTGGPRALPGAKSHWQRKGQPQQTTAHFRAKILYRNVFGSRNLKVSLDLTHWALKHGLRSESCDWLLVHLLWLPLGSCKQCLQSQEPLFSFVIQRPPLSWAGPGTK